MTTLGHGDIKPNTLWGAFIVTVQVLMGLFIVVFVLEPFVSLLSQEQGSKSSKRRNAIETGAKKKPEREIAKHLSIMIAVLALIASIYSLYLSREELAIAHRPYVYEICRQTNKNDKVVMDTNTVLFACRNAPAKITEKEFSYITVQADENGNDIATTRYKVKDPGEQILYPTDPPSSQWTVLYDFKKEILDHDPKIKLRRKVRIEYKEFSSDRAYYFDGTWDYNKKFNIWEAESMLGN